MKTTNDDYTKAFPEIWDNIAKQPSLDTWQRLYKAAIEIKKIKPWLEFWDSDLITVQLPNRDEPVFISVMGKSELCYGISVYPGYKSFLGCLMMREAADGEPSFITYSYQNCLNCYFGNKEELSEEERSVLKQLQLSFRGANQWIYFRCLKTGHMPWLINTNQALLLIEVLETLTGALKDIKHDGLHVDFLAEETLHRYFEPKDGKWYNAVKKAPQIPFAAPKLIISDQLFVARLKKCKSNGAVLELDLIYLPVPYQISVDIAPAFPKVCLLADAPNQDIVDQYMLSSDDEDELVALGMLSDYIKNNGKPRRISVRDNRMSFLLEDFCDKLGIQLVAGKGLPMIDYFAQSMTEFMRNMPR